MMTRPPLVVRRPQTAANPFDRQMRIPGWDQERVVNARVLIAGVGALGNVCAEDLARMGVRHFVLVDFDTIETSNLSRTSLFRPGDEGRAKVCVAAERLHESVLTRDPHILSFNADVIWGLGWGVYRRVDVVLGCVDSAEARAAVGAPAWTFGVPAVFGGIFGFNAGVMIQGVGQGPCVACSFAQQEWVDLRRRYSCDQVLRTFTEAAKIPATLVGARFAGTVMLKASFDLLFGDDTDLATRFFVTRWPALERCTVRRLPRCPFHLEIKEVREIPQLSSRMTAGAVVEQLASLFGAQVTLKLGRDFLLCSRCKSCNDQLRLWRPRHQVFEHDLACQRCQAAGRPLVVDPQISVLRDVSVQTDQTVLGLTLTQLGVPPLHVLEVLSPQGSQWVELTGDLPHLLPDWPENMSRERTAHVS